MGPSPECKSHFALFCKFNRKRVHESLPEDERRERVNFLSVKSKLYPWLGIWWNIWAHYAHTVCITEFAPQKEFFFVQARNIQLSEHATSKDYVRTHLSIYF